MYVDVHNEKYHTYTGRIPPCFLSISVIFDQPQKKAVLFPSSPFCVKYQIKKNDRQEGKK